MNFQLSMTRLITVLSVISISQVSYITYRDCSYKSICYIKSIPKETRKTSTIC